MLTTEINPTKFLDTEIIISNNEVVTSVHRKESKLPVPWESKVPKHYKRNTLLGELKHAKKISSNFQKEVKKLKEKFSRANFPLRFINSVVVQFNKNMYNNKERNEENEMIFPPQLFEISKKILSLQVPFCQANEKRSKNFLNKFYNCTNEKFTLIFPLKIYILQARFIKGFVLMKPNGMWGLDIWSTIILVGSLNHKNIYIRISTICLLGQLFTLHQKLIEHKKILKHFI